MRLHLLFTRHRSKLLPKPCRFETAAKIGAFSKRYGFICRVKQWNRIDLKMLLFWCEICIVQFKIVNLAHSAALAYNITTLIFWRKRFRAKTSKPHRFWRGFEVIEPCQRENRFRVNAAWANRLARQFAQQIPMHNLQCQTNCLVTMDVNNGLQLLHKKPPFNGAKCYVWT